MRPPLAPLSVIKSISQRALARHWREIAADRRLPAFDRFSPSSRMHDPQQLMFWDVKAAGDAFCFKTLRHGQYLSDAFGIDPPPLQPLQTVVPPALQDVALSGLSACAQARAPLYTIVSAQDDGDHPIHCERLLLPFGHDGNEPQQIVASLQLISVDGRFTRQTVVERFAAQAQLTYMAEISFGEVTEQQKDAG